MGCLPRFIMITMIFWSRKIICSRAKSAPRHSVYGRGWVHFITAAVNHSKSLGRAVTYINLWPNEAERAFDLPRGFGNLNPRLVAFVNYTSLSVKSGMWPNGFCPSFGIMSRCPFWNISLTSTYLNCPSWGDFIQSVQKGAPQTGAYADVVRTLRNRQIDDLLGPVQYW